MSYDDPTDQFAAQGESKSTLRDLFNLVLSISDELKSIRADFEQYRSHATPLSNTMESIRADASARGDRQEGFDRTLVEMRGDMSEMCGDLSGVRSHLNDIRGEINEIRGEMNNFRSEVAELRKLTFRVENKLDGISKQFSEIKNDLHYQAVRLLEVESKVEGQSS